MTVPPAGPALFLSHVLDIATPAYGGGEGLHVRAESSIAAGNTANSSHWSLPNHLGTHIDAPRHFYDGALTIDQAAPIVWWFDSPTLVDVPKGDDELIQAHEIEPHVPVGCDLVLLRTGFEAHRGTDRYWRSNPGIAASLCEWLRLERPSVRALGMDLISVTSRAHREEGRAAHRAFLSPTESMGIPRLLIEDMSLAACATSPSSVCILPLRVRDADGAPCTAVAWGNERR